MFAQLFGQGADRGDHSWSSLWEPCGNHGRARGSPLSSQPSPVRRLAPPALAAPACHTRSLCGWNSRGSGTPLATAPCKFKDVGISGRSAAGSDSPEPGSCLLATQGCDHSAAPRTLNARSCVPGDARPGIFSSFYPELCWAIRDASTLLPFSSPSEIGSVSLLARVKPGFSSPE